jgi:hypothetical protein
MIIFFPCHVLIPFPQQAKCTIESSGIRLKLCEEKKSLTKRKLTNLQIKSRANASLPVSSNLTVRHTRLLLPLRNHTLMTHHIRRHKLYHNACIYTTELRLETCRICLFVFFALQPFGCIFHSHVAGFSLLFFEVSCSHTTTRHSR